MKKIFAIMTAALAGIAIAGCGNHETSGGTGDYSMSYEVSFEPSAHYIDVAMQYVPKTAGTKDVTFKMAVWAPGYYKIVDFPKYLTDFEAEDQNGRSLRWIKVGKNGWAVSPADTMNISYRVFADARSVVDSRVEEGMAFIAPSGVFMYLDGDTRHPVDIRFNVPQEWQKVSTALPRAAKNGVKAVVGVRDTEFTAPDFDVFFDSPLLMGNHYSKTVSHGGHDYEFALETPQGFEGSPMAEDFLKGVDKAIDIFGDTAYEDYHLLLLGAGGGGLEHQASQACYTAGHWDFVTREEYLSELRFLSHEYFHNYNVKAIRPIELGPFDYEHEVYTPMLWVSEGFTVYYESILLLRAGIETEEEHLKFLSDYIRTIESTEGHRHMSLRQSSYDIWLNFFNSASNGKDVRISYYDKGPILGLLFDAKIQTMTEGKRSLDNLMNLLYWRYYKDAGRGFTEEEFWAAAEEVAGGSLSDLRRYVDTTDEIDYESILTPYGLSLDRETWTLKKINN